jgi:hypothetical protein
MKYSKYDLDDALEAQYNHLEDKFRNLRIDLSKHITQYKEYLNA